MSNLLNYSKDDLYQLYCIDCLSWDEIAKKYKTYPNKVRRDAAKLGIESRTKAHAQTVALDMGRAIHPTQGKPRSEATKIKISETVATNWSELSDEEKNERSKQAKAQWANMTDEERKAFQKASAIAIRKAAIEGSKLEKYLYWELLNVGYEVEFHKERVLANQNLHLDLFLPKIGVAIEVDGLSHFEPIWGADTLEKNKQADHTKAGLLLNAGAILIRVQCTKKTLSNKYKRDVLTNILETLEKLKTDRSQRYITINLGD